MDVSVHVRVDRICHEVFLRPLFVFMDVSVYVRVDRICHEVFLRPLFVFMDESVHACKSAPYLP